MDSVDLFILNRIHTNNVLVTQDIGLASIALAKGVHVISPRGIIYKEESIQIALDFRYLSAKERRQGRYGKGPKPFTSVERNNFIQSFSGMLSKIEGD